MRGLIPLTILFALIAPAEARPPVEAFASLPSVRNVALSPDGKKIALIANRKGVSNVILQVLGTPGFETLYTTRNERLTIEWIRWANDHRLLLSVRFPSRRFRVNVMETRLFSLSIDEEDVFSLVDFGPADRPRRRPWVQDRIVDLLPDDPEHILLALALDARYPGVYRANVERKGARLRWVEQERTGFVDWMTDQQHRIRIGVWRTGLEYEIHYLDIAEERWKMAWRFEAYSKQQVWPLGFGLDPATLYVRAAHDGRMAIFRTDLSDPALPLSLVYADPEHDVEATLLHSPRTGEAVGIADDSGVLLLWDPAYESFARGLEAALPGLNLRLVGMSRDENRYVVRAGNDRHPATYYFGDREQKTLTPFAEAYPRLDPETLAGKRTIHYTARDGTEIEGFLSLPRGGGDEGLPVIVLPRAWPALDHVSAGFDYWSEFFASRGYAVLQMNVRGSPGYGIEFQRAGFGNWGLEMQDDVEDGTYWLIEQGIADPARICIVGAGYGGYAALVGVAHTPDLFRCAVSFAGFTDLAAVARRRRGNEWIAQVVGTNVRDLRARSPVKLADTIDVPVLLVHGTEDSYVPPLHGRRMRDALEKAGADVQYIEQDGGDHFLSNEAHRLELFRAMETFLARHLGSRGRDGAFETHAEGSAQPNSE